MHIHNDDNYFYIICIYYNLSFFITYLKLIRKSSVQYIIIMFLETVQCSFSSHLFEKWLLVPQKVRPAGHSLETFTATNNEFWNRELDHVPVMLYGRRTRTKTFMKNDSGRWSGRRCLVFQRDWLRPGILLFTVFSTSAKYDLVILVYNF